jgi:hypothetical protein
MQVTPRSKKGVCLASTLGTWRYDPLAMVSLESGAISFRKCRIRFNVLPEVPHQVQCPSNFAFRWVNLWVNYAEGLEKKVKLMRHFRGYLSQDGRSAVERSSGGLGPEPGSEARHPAAAEATAKAAADAETTERAAAVTAATATETPTPASSSDADAATSSSSSTSAPYLPHVKNWLRTKHAILFRLSNRTIQVNFQDGSEVLLSSEAAATVFTSKSGGGCTS